MRAIVVLMLLAACAGGAPKGMKKAEGAFLIADRGGHAFLDPDGRERERIKPDARCAALSPDGRWLACLQYDEVEKTSALVLLSRGRKEAPVRVPDVRVAVGEGCGPVWSADGGRLFVAQYFSGGRTVRRVYDLTKKTLTEVRLQEGCHVTDW
ncbi:MAG: hypothetical protein ACRC33_13555, partial [Gemmataceae bacterium]